MSSFRKEDYESRMQLEYRYNKYLEEDLSNFKICKLSERIDLAKNNGMKYLEIDHGFIKEVMYFYNQGWISDYESNTIKASCGYDIPVSIKIKLNQ
jgi:hypothetical protein